MNASARAKAAAKPNAILVLSATDFETAALRGDLLLSAVNEAAPRSRGRQTPRRRPGGDAAGTSRSSWPPRLTGKLNGVPIILAASGVGKANAAAAVASVVQRVRFPVAAVLQIGVGGAYPGSGLALGEVALAHSEFDLDLGVGRRPAWSGLESLGFPAFAAHSGEMNRLDLESDLLGALRGVRGLRTAAFATSDTVTADAAHAASIAAAHGVAVESMEGAAAAQVSAALGLPFVELRAISNTVGERDKGRWRLSEAVTAAATAAPAVLTVMWEHLTAPKEAR